MLQAGEEREGRKSAARTAAEVAAIVRAPTVLGNQIEILSGYREASGGNHPRKEGADPRERENRAIE